MSGEAVRLDNYMGEPRANSLERYFCFIFFSPGLHDWSYVPELGCAKLAESTLSRKEVLE